MKFINYNINEKNVHRKIYLSEIFAILDLNNYLLGNIFNIIQTQLRFKFNKNINRYIKIEINK